MSLRHEAVFVGLLLAALVNVGGLRTSARVPFLLPLWMAIEKPLFPLNVISWLTLQT